MIANIVPRSVEIRIMVMSKKDYGICVVYGGGEVHCADCRVVRDKIFL